jgi:hypothetical protein
MEHLVREHGVNLDELRITVTSVDTIEGPGLRLVVRYETADDAATSPWDRPGGASGDEPPV